MSVSCSHCFVFFSVVFLSVFVFLTHTVTHTQTDTHTDTQLHFYTDSPHSSPHSSAVGAGFIRTHKIPLGMVAVKTTYTHAHVQQNVVSVLLQP